MKQIECYSNKVYSYSKLTLKKFNKILTDICNELEPPRKYSWRYGKYIIEGSSLEEVMRGWLDLIKRDNPEIYKNFKLC